MKMQADPARPIFVEEELSPTKIHDDMITIDTIDGNVPVMSDFFNHVITYSQILAWLNGNGWQNVIIGLDKFTDANENRSNIYYALTNLDMFDADGNAITDNLCLLPVVGADINIPLRIRFFCRMGYSVEEVDYIQSFPTNSNEVYETVLNSQEPYRFIDEFMPLVSRQREYADSGALFFDEYFQELTPDENGIVYSDTEHIYVILTCSILGSISNAIMDSDSNLDLRLTTNDILFPVPIDNIPTQLKEIHPPLDNWTLMLADGISPKQNNLNGYLDILSSFVKRYYYYINTRDNHIINKFLAEQYVTGVGIETIQHNIEYGDNLGVNFCFYQSDVPLASGILGQGIALNIDKSVQIKTALSLQPRVGNDYTNVVRTVEATKLVIRDTNYVEYSIIDPKDISDECNTLQYTTWTHNETTTFEAFDILFESLDVERIFDIYSSEIEDLELEQSNIAAVLLQINVRYTGDIDVVEGIIVNAPSINVLIGFGGGAFPHPTYDFSLIKNDGNFWANSKFGIVLPSLPAPAGFGVAALGTSNLVITTAGITLNYPTGDIVMSNNAIKYLSNYAINTIEGIQCRVIKEWGSDGGVLNSAPLYFASGTITPHITIKNIRLENDSITILFDQQTVSGAEGSQFSIAEVPSPSEPDQQSEVYFGYSG